MQKANWFKKAPVLWIVCIVLLGVVILQFVVMQGLNKKNAALEVEATRMSQITPDSSATSILSEATSTKIPQITDAAASPTGWIVFRRETISGESVYDYDYEYFIMDGEGNQIQLIGFFRGAPSWSPDGEYIAVSCEYDVMQLCILDVKDISDFRKFPPPTDSSSMIYKKLTLPDACEGLVSPVNGLESISWSPDGQRIAVVCGDSYANDYWGTPRKVCILPFDGEEPYCWEDNDITIRRAEWSPVEDVLAVVSSDSKIYLIGSDGKDPVFLTEGKTLAWSPDGEQVAFTLAPYLAENILKATPGFEEKYKYAEGIAVINKDGTDFRFLYIDISTPYTEGDDISFSCPLVGCPLSWSPDGRYIVFQIDVVVGCCGLAPHYRIFRLDIMTGELMCLSCFNFIYRNNIDPDWGP